MAKDRQSHIGASLRQKLMDLGIPEEFHTLKDLSAAFPKEFKADQMCLDLNSMAAVLIHLCERGIIKIKSSRFPSPRRNRNVTGV